MVWRKQPDEKRADEEIEIRVHGFVIHAEALTDLRGIPHLPVICREHAEEAIGCLRFCRQTPCGQVALGEQRKIVRLPSGIIFSRDHTTIGIASAEPQPVARGVLWQLHPKKRRKFDEREAPRERFRYVRHERGRNRTEQQEASHAAALVIDGSPYSREYGGHRLRFIEHDERARCDETVPLQIESELVGRLLEVEVLPSQRASERCFTALSRSDERDDRRCAQPLAKHFFCDAADHVLQIRN